MLKCVKQYLFSLYATFSIIFIDKTTYKQKISKYFVH